MPRRFVARAIVPALALACLAGCSTPSGGTAFEVDGARTSLVDVNAAAKGCVEVMKGQVTLEQIEPSVASMMIVGDMARSVDKSLKVEISDADRADAVKKLQGEELVANQQCAKAVNAYAGMVALSEKVGKDKTLEAIEQVKVQTNPRFGNFDVKKLQFTGESGSLSSQDLGQGTVFGR